jgi:hypothetical protein
MSSRGIPALLALLSLAACSLSTRASAPAYPALEAAEFVTMVNVSESSGVWFGGLPTRDDLDLARRRGVRRVIALCDPALYAELDLLGQCAQLELELRELGAPGDGTDTDVARLLALLADEARPKTLLFCEDGSICAMLFAIYRVIHDGVALVDALSEARRAGMPEGAAEAFVRASVERHGS